MCISRRNRQPANVCDVSNVTRFATLWRHLPFLWQKFPLVHFQLGMTETVAFCDGVWGGQQYRESTRLSSIIEIVMFLPAVMSIFFSPTSVFEVSPSLPCVGFCFFLHILHCHYEHCPALKWLVVGHKVSLYNHIHFQLSYSINIYLIPGSRKQ